MNGHRFKGKLMWFRGELKRQWGRLLDDDLRQAEGTYEKVVGILQERYGDSCAGLVRKRYAEKQHDLIRWWGRWQQAEKADVMSGGNASWIAWIAQSVKSVSNHLR